MSTPHTIDSWRTWAKAQVSADAQHEPDQLLIAVLGVNRAWLFAHGDDALSHENQTRLDDALTRLCSGEPLAYVLGSWSFYGLDLIVSPAVLVPRPETELLVDHCLSRIKKTGNAKNTTMRILDLGTGSGAIALALAKHLPNAKVVAVDQSEEALAVAKQNAIKLNINNVSFRQGSWFEPMHTHEQFDLIVSNPPYLGDDDPHLPNLSHEPRSALVAGLDGLDDIRLITEQAHAFLQPQGALLIEHGMNQGKDVRQLFLIAGYQNIQTLKDLEQRDRVTLGIFTN